MGVILKPNAIYMSPNGSTIDPSDDNDFSLIINGDTCVAYRFSVYDLENTRLSTPSTDRVDLVSTLNNGDTLTITMSSSSITAGDEYRWKVDLYGNDLTVSSINTGTDILTVANHNLATGDIVYIQSDDTLPSGTSEYTAYYIRRLSSNTLALYETYESAKIDGTKVNITSVGVGNITISNIAISQQVAFYAYSDPTFSLSTTTITEQSNNFIPSYSQSENIGVNNFRAYLYDSDGILLGDSGTQYSSNVEWEFDGLLSGNVYGVQFIGETNIYQSIDTGVVSYTVSYTQPDIETQMSAENNSNKSSITVQYPELVQITGTITGTSLYVPDFIETGNTALRLDSGSILVYEGLTITNEHTQCILWYPTDDTYDGDIIKLENTTSGSYIIVGYDNTIDKFYRNVNGVYFYNATKTLALNQVYVIALTNLNLYIVDYATP